MGPKTASVPMSSINVGDIGDKKHILYNSDGGVGGGVLQFIEVWDYVGGASFRGFVEEKSIGERSLFLFFEHVEGTQLKHGLIALIELASECFSCDRLVICLDRKADGLHSLIRDLGWVGFELITLSHWMQPSINTVIPVSLPPYPSQLPQFPPRFPSSNVRSGSFSSVSSTSSSVADEEVTSEQWIFVGMDL